MSSDVQSAGLGPWRRSFLGVPVDAVDLDTAVDMADAAMRDRRPLRHCALNVAKFVAMGSDPVLRNDVVASDLITADGMGIVWGARLLSIDLPERVTGIDLMDRLMELCARRGYRPFLLGAREEVLRTTMARLTQKYPGLTFAGARNGYFSDGEEAGVVEQIGASRADCLFIAITSPKKERFSGTYFPTMGVPFVMGVGGAFDVVAGVTRRAPPWMQRSGLEWLFRLLQEPRRMWRRYAVSNARFALILLRALVGRGRA
ncbi:MAG: hypothetical protein RLY86_628 [Pseudomonadota bacterium]|jgi:N-acetylglucosaminyldiphosphoundecaprenol N-acetyl-beta-D-mannosaminyltransferase